MPHKPGHPFDNDPVYEKPEQDTSLRTQLALLHEHLKRQDADLKDIKAAVIGDGKSGLMARVDRHDRTISNLTRFFWIVVAAVATLALKAFVFNPPAHETTNTTVVAPVPVSPPVPSRSP